MVKTTHSANPVTLLLFSSSANAASAPRWGLFPTFPTSSQMLPTRKKVRVANILWSLDRILPLYTANHDFGAYIFASLDRILPLYTANHDNSAYIFASLLQWFCVCVCRSTERLAFDGRQPHGRCHGQTMENTRVECACMFVDVREH